MEFDLLIRGAKLASSAGIAEGDLGILNGTIAAIGDLGSAVAQSTIDASGLIVMPGAIDTQVHFREPGLEHKEDIESGTRAALMGGVTSVLEMPNTMPNTTSAETLSDKLLRSQGRAWCNIGFFVGASTDNIPDLAELEKLPGTPGIKIFMGSSTGTLLVRDDSELRNVLTHCTRRCPIHAEDEARNLERRDLLSNDPSPQEHPYLRDAESARLATERILRLSAETRHPVHILHVSTADELPLIAEAKKLGLGTTAEVTPQHLFFQSPECYERLGTLAQMNPPIRSHVHQEALWRALESGVFDVFGSDHAPHTLEEKARPYPSSPSGMPGVQTLLPILLTFVAQGRLTMSRLISMVCERPADLYGIAGKGKLKVGFDADITLVDPDHRYVFDRNMVESKCGWSPYEGETMIGSIEHVIMAGNIVVRDRQRTGTPTGRILRFV